MRAAAVGRPRIAGWQPLGFHTNQSGVRERQAGSMGLDGQLLLMRTEGHPRPHKSSAEGDEGLLAVANSPQEGPGITAVGRAYSLQQTDWFKASSGSHIVELVYCSL